MGLFVSLGCFSKVPNLNGFCQQRCVLSVWRPEASKSRCLQHHASLTVLGDLSLSLPASGVCRSPWRSLGTWPSSPWVSTPRLCLCVHISPFYKDTKQIDEPTLITPQLRITFPRTVTFLNSWGWHYHIFWGGQKFNPNAGVHFPPPGNWGDLGELRWDKVLCDSPAGVSVPWGGVGELSGPPVCLCLGVCLPCRALSSHLQNLGFSACHPTAPETLSWFPPSVWEVFCLLTLSL